MAAPTRLRCYTPQGGASPLLSAEYRQTGTGSFHAWRSRATTAAVLSRTLSRRSQLSVGFASGSMLHDRTLAAAAAPMGVVHLRRSQLCDDCRKRRQRTDRPWVFTRGGAPSHRAPEGRAAAGAWEFRPRSCVRSAGGGCPRTSPPLGFPGGFQRLRVPSPVFGSSRRAVLRASGALSQPSCLLPTGVSLSGRLSAGAYRVLDPVPISRRRVIV